MILERKAGRLLVKAYETRAEMGRAAAAEAAQALRAVLADKGSCRVIFAAAPSQNEFLEALCGADVDWSRVDAFHMDEYIGLPEEAPQGFGNFLKRAIFDRVPFRSVNRIRGGAADVDGEIARYSALLREQPADVVFMGIGENGHIAFNDPHVAHFDDDCLMRAVELDETCRRQQVNDGCFAALDQVPTHALTLTIPALPDGRATSKPLMFSSAQKPVPSVTVMLCHVIPSAETAPCAPDSVKATKPHVPCPTALHAPCCGKSALCQCRPSKLNAAVWDGLDAVPETAVNLSPPQHTAVHGAAGASACCQTRPSRDTAMTAG